MNTQAQLSTRFLVAMKTPSPSWFMKALKRFPKSHLKRHVAMTFALSTAIAVSATEFGQAFPTPEAAVAALVSAAGAADTNAFRIIFGPASAELQNPDRVQAANELSAFTAAVSQHQRLVHESDATCVLEIGTNAWPFPIPIVMRNGQWFFDTAAGKNEILNRRIGKNELATLQSVRGYVEAQREYASKDRDGDEVLEYAQKIVSSAGAKDGLFWSPQMDGEISPLGPLAADAAAEGYGKKTNVVRGELQPFHGYFFKVLTRQAKSASGGSYAYVINGNMIGGFALVAWPAEYGESGIMTFIVNQQGRVYQKDLGLKTAGLAGAIRTYDPDKSWSLSAD